MEDTLETTDLSRDGISHLKMQNTPNVKARKRTHTHAQYTPIYSRLYSLRVTAESGCVLQSMAEKVQLLQREEG